jgi:hypothetical protein
MGKPRYEIEPQRDLYRIDRPSGVDEDATNFRLCDEGEAEIWAVFQQDAVDAYWYLIRDFPTRAAAEAFIVEQEASRCL